MIVSLSLKMGELRELLLIIVLFQNADELSWNTGRAYTKTVKILGYVEKPYLDIDKHQRSNTSWYGIELCFICLLYLGDSLWIWALHGLKILV